jgi:hypothetical protein
MSEISGERIEPAARVEPQGPGGQSDSGSRRQRPPTKPEPEMAEDSEAPAHQVDRLV